MRENDRQRHQLSGLATGVAEHHALVPGAEQLELIVVAGPRLHRTVDAQRDVGRLFVDGNAHAARFGVEADRRTRITDLAHDLARKLRNIDVGPRRHLAGDVNLTGDGERFDRDARHRVVFDQSVEHRVGNLIGELIWMTLGYRFAGKESLVRHFRSPRSTRQCISPAPA